MNYNFKDPKIQLKIKHSIIKNMPYFLLHDLIKYKCLTEFILELTNYLYCHKNCNYTEESLQKVVLSHFNYDSSSRIILGAFPWKYSLYKDDYWSYLHKTMLSNERKQKKQIV